MSSKFSFADEDFICPVCHDVFEDPVILFCSHSFCKECLEKWWTEKDMNECPVCKKINSILDPPCNLALKNLCETITQKKRGRAPKRQRTSPEDLCGLLHTEELKLFCTECQQPVCLACAQPADKHTNHPFCSIREAALDLKVDIERVHDGLQHQLEVCTTFKATCDTAAAYIKNQNQMATGQIKEYFRKLHRFLHDEEEARLFALREEEQQKSQMMREKIEGLNREILTLSRTIRAVELRAEDISFLQNYKATVERLQRPASPSTQQDPQRIPGAMLDVAKHLGNLSFRVWNKMKDMISYHPVILNPKTAHPTQKVSDDMTSVSCACDIDDPSRSSRSETQRLRGLIAGFHEPLFVTGSEGFDSGTHSWDVEVGHGTDWEVGVLADDDDNLCWNMGFNGHMYTLNSPDVFSSLPLPQRQIHPRIRVHLDWNRGKLSFSDPDTNKHLHTFTHTFTDMLYPYVYNFDSTFPLKMLPGKVTVTVT